MDDSNVIQAFKPTELPEQTFVIEKPPVGRPFHCGHGRLSIDPHNRSIECADCGKTLDRFDYLHNNAHVLARAWQDHASVRRELSTMQERITELKKDEKRLKAQISRHKDKIVIADVRGKQTL